MLPRHNRNAGIPSSSNSIAISRSHIAPRQPQQPLRQPPPLNPSRPLQSTTVVTTTTRGRTYPVFSNLLLSAATFLIFTLVNTLSTTAAARTALDTSTRRRMQTKAKGGERSVAPRAGYSERRRRRNNNSYDYSNSRKMRHEKRHERRQKAMTEVTTMIKMTARWVQSKPYR